jgi:glycosyltransferase involved in cell wall biosynthesis
MSAPPCVSVVLPTYNRATIIGETVESILIQEFQDFELLVVSDGCTDDTEAVVGSYNDSRIRLVKQSNSGGPAAPRNAGIQNASGKYIAFCDDDDLWMPQKLARQVAVLERDPEAALCFTNGVVFGDGGAYSRRALKNGFDDDHFRRLLYGNFIANSSVLVRRDVLAAVGPFNIDSALHGTEDYEMWLRVAYAYKLVSIDEPLFRYRVHRGNLAGNRAKATLRGLYVLRSRGWSRGTRTRESILFPMIWQWLKYAIYTLTRH